VTQKNALDTAREYYHAWSGGDFEAAMQLVAPDIVCHAPAGQVEGAQAFRAFMGPFAAMVQSSSLVAAYGDDEQAVLIYETATPLVADAPGAELHRVTNGRITELRLLFDRLPFHLARNTA